MAITIELFYSPTCLYCPKARKVLLEVLDNVNHEVHVDEVNVFSSKGLERANKYGIMAVPAIVVRKRHKLVGVPKKEELLRIIHEEPDEMERD